MKTNHVLKTGFLAIAFVVLSVGAKAQTDTRYVDFTTTPESIDTVTVGSRMPYFVAPQATVPGLKFEYKWLFDPTLAILNYAGSPATPGTGAGFYVENEISVVMPAVGSIKIGTNVQSLLVSTGAVLCPADATDVEYNIQVVAKPTLSWTSTEETFCGNTSPVNIPFSLTGYGLWEVFYEVDYTALTTGATPTNIVPATKVEIGSNGSKAGAYSFDLPAATFTNPGKYEIRIKNLTDRISRKSLTPIIAAAGTEIPAATAVYTVNVYPAPTTNPLQHIKNMPTP